MEESSLYPIATSNRGAGLASGVSFYDGAVIVRFGAVYTVGQYWNGQDWWVLRPTDGTVVITSTSPEAVGDGQAAPSVGAARVRNGAVWNWNTGDEAAQGSGLSAGVGYGRQGWDSHDPRVDSGGGNTITNSMIYEDSINIDPAHTGRPFVASSEGAFMKAVSLADEIVEPQPRPQILSDLALLTVVDSVPRLGAFRPGAHTRRKAYRWTVHDLNLSLLPSNLPSPSSTPRYESTLSRVQRHHVMGHLNYDSNRPFMPSNHMNNYGTNNGRDIASAVLLAMTDSVTESQRNHLINSVVQIGIDVFDRYNEGGRWNPNGGLYIGYKLPLVVAATLLDNAAMRVVAGTNPSRSPVSASFAEDRATWIITKADIDRSVDGERQTYTAVDLGMPEWGEQHTRQNGRDDRRVGARYRAENVTTYLGAATAANLIAGARETWNWKPCFDYADRLLHRTFWRDNAAGNAILRRRFGSDNYVDAFNARPRPYGSYFPVRFHVQMARAFRGSQVDPSGVPIWDWS